MNELRAYIRKLIRFPYLVGLTLLLSLLSQQSSAQNIDAFATIKLSKNEVFVQEPVKITITVYSSTWFTDALDYGNLTISNSFVLPFTRTLSSIKYVNNKKYATLTFYYIAFPYSDGTIEIPPLAIKANIPPENDYKGKDITLKTKATAIKVKPIPEQANQKQWMVAKNAYISEKWSKSLQNIKVGDVVERTIYVKAMGTLPSFIPDFSFKKLDFASVYPKEATFKDLKTDTDVNGSKVQTITYLFEKEGLFTIPNLSITWWNPYAQKIFSKSTSSIEVRVKANPNLNMLSTARDSLNINQSLIQVERTEPWYKSFTLKQWISLALITLLTYFILRLTISLTKRIIQHRKDYKYSDSYYFNLIRKARNNKEIINALYQWLYKTGNVYSTREMNSDSELQASFEELQESIFLNKKSTYKKYSFIKKISRIKKGGKINTNKFRLNP